MQKLMICVSTVVLVIASAMPAKTENKTSQSSSAPPPLSLDGLLGDDERLSEATKLSDESLADNFACLVCHGNFEEEEMVAVHAKERVGCVKCHGESIKHADDEDHVIPPDKMFDREEVDTMCGKCHRRHTAPAREVLARWQERCSDITDTSEIACTNCHFQHQMENRTVWWDRKSGELVVRKAGQTTKPLERSSGDSDL